MGDFYELTKPCFVVLERLTEAQIAEKTGLMPRDKKNENSAAKPTKNTDYSSSKPNEVTPPTTPKRHKAIPLP